MESSFNFGSISEDPAYFVTWMGLTTTGWAFLDTVEVVGRPVVLGVKWVAVTGTDCIVKRTIYDWQEYVVQAPHVDIMMSSSSSCSSVVNIWWKTSEHMSHTFPTIVNTHTSRMAKLRDGVDE